MQKLSKPEDDQEIIQMILTKIENDIPDYGINELSGQVQEHIKALAISFKNQSKPEYNTAIEFIIQVDLFIN
jgi:hypothetical protein